MRQNFRQCTIRLIFLLAWIAPCLSVPCAAEDELAVQQSVLDAIRQIELQRIESAAEVDPGMVRFFEQIQHQIELFPNTRRSDVEQVLARLGTPRAAAVGPQSLDDAIRKWLETLPEFSAEDLRRLIQDESRREAEVVAESMDRRRAFLRDRLGELDVVLNGAGAGRASWDQYLLWKQTNQLAQQSEPSLELLNQVDRRWRNAPLTWSHPQILGVSSAVRELAIGIRRVKSADSLGGNQRRLERVLALWAESSVEDSSPSTSTLHDNAARDELARLRGEFVTLGRSPAMVDRLDRAFSHANCVVRFSSSWLERHSRADFERPIVVDDNYGGANVQGTGVLTGQLTASLIPQIGTIRGAIRVHGVSRTRTFGGSSGVSVDSSSTTVAEGIKPFLFTPEGLASEPARGTADTDVVYNSISSGGRSRRQSIAVNEVYARRSSSEQQASAEARQRLSSELDRRFDDAVAPWQARYRNEVRNSLIRNDTFFPTIRCGSTNHFVFWRCWLRDWDQFAAPHEPPAVNSPGDCVVSLHESFLQRASWARLSGVQVDRQFVRQHWGWLLDAIPGVSPTEPEAGDAENFALTLADDDSVHFAVSQGRVTMAFHFANIEADGESYPHQLVKADYELVHDGDAILFRRPGPLTVTLTDESGQARNSGSRRVALRRLIERKMEQVLQPELRFSVISLSKQPDAGSEELVFTEAVAEDGWLQFVLRSRPVESVISSPSSPAP